jgi:hypothetical protein
LSVVAHSVQVASGFWDPWPCDGNPLVGNPLFGLRSRREQESGLGHVRGSARAREKCIHAQGG